MAVQYTGHMIQAETCDNDTALPLVGVLVMLYGLYGPNVIILSITVHLIGDKMGRFD